MIYKMPRIAEESVAIEEAVDEPDDESRPLVDDVN